MATSEPDSMFRERRAAHHQSLFREINERIEPLNKSFNQFNRLNDFICECANEGCTTKIPLSVDEYESIRQHPNRFAVLPSDEHVWPDVEEVTERHERYWIVAKIGHGATVVTKLDPRSRTRLTE